MSDFHETARSNFDLDQAAAALRKRLGLGNTDFAPDVFELLQRASRSKETPLFGLEVIVLPDSEMGNAEAFATCVPPQITFRESVMSALRRGDPRARMTAIHELMHIWLGHAGGPKHRMADGNAELRFAKGAKSGEHQAKYGAAVFLVPSSMAKELSGPDEIRRRFNVSAIAANIRFDQLALSGPRATPTDIADLLSNALGSKVVTGNSDVEKRRERSMKAVEAAWNKASIIPTLDPAEWRHCHRGQLVQKPQYLKDKSAKGWCVKNGVVMSYAALRHVGMSDVNEAHFAEAPCSNCGMFAVESKSRTLVCTICQKKQNLS